MSLKSFKRYLYTAVLCCLCLQAGAAWPVYLDMDTGQTRKIRVKGADGRNHRHTITVRGIDYEYEPSYWYRIPEKFGNRHIKEAKVTVEVDGRQVVLRQRPYEMPVAVNGLRLYVEDTERRAKEASYLAIKDFPRQVRLSVCAEGEPWGPGDMLFPIEDYRWGSAPYMNTWGSLVPYNSLYYHRGEDFGAVPDILPVRAILKGKVEATPLPDGDGRSNAIMIRHDKDFVYRISHVNTPFVDKNIVVGAEVTRGMHMARTGNTYKRPGAQYRDPHMHINFIYGGRDISTFPSLIEAYLRDYPDNVIAISGSYAYTIKGGEVELDGSRSIVRPGHKIASYRWKLHDERTADTPTVKVRYDKPGLYSEELEVTTEAGDTDRDFIQVRVFSGDRKEKEIVYGWAYHTPVRGIKPGQTVRFLSRLANTAGGVTIDFGDGTTPKPIVKGTTHSYAAPGRYTVTLSAKGRQEDTATVKMEVVVE